MRLLCWDWDSADAGESQPLCPLFGKCPVAVGMLTLVTKGGIAVKNDVPTDVGAPRDFGASTLTRFEGTRRHHHSSVDRVPRVGATILHRRSDPIRERGLGSGR